MVYITGLTRENIENALLNTNKVFNNNIAFKRLEKTGNRYIVTLKVKDSRALGSRIGFSGQRVNAACWHVYGYFFDECFKLNPSCTIKQNGENLTPQNNWTDKNIGSVIERLMYSNACDCKDSGIHTAIMANLEK